MSCVKLVLRFWARAAFLLAPAILCLNAVSVWATPVATTTTLTISSKTVNSHQITVMTATVTPALTHGLVLFYDGKVLLGTGQIVNTGTKYTHGSAYLSAELGPGTHSLKVAFAGTANDAASTSTAHSTSVAGGTSSTTISSSGSANNYTLTSQVVANGPLAPTGAVNFLDQTGGNAQFASSTLGTGNTLTTKFGTAAAYPNYNPDYWAYQGVVADFNGDGLLDLAEIGYYAEVGIHLGKGDGTLQAAKSYCMTTGATPVPCPLLLSEPDSIAVADFNGDGIPDLVAADEGDISVLLGKGDGTFQPPVHYPVGGGGDGIVVVADFDRDGIPDLALGLDGGVSILLGNGDGSFQPHVETAVSGNGSGYLTVGDFNHDGIPDLAVTGWNSGSLAVLLGVGDGSFQAEKDTDIDLNPANPGDNPIVAADIKGTGYAGDLVICGGNQVDVLIGKGDGTFPAPGDAAEQIYYPNGSSFYPYVGGIAVGDVNGDGIPDIALTWYSSDADVGRVAVFSGKAGGTFNPTPKNAYVGQQPVWVGLGDFNGDGTLDLVTSNENDKTLSVVLNSVTNTATATATGITVPGVGTQNVYAQYAGTSALASSTSSTIALTGNGVAVPLLTSISPTSTTVGGAAFTLTVNGSNFVSGDVVKWNGGVRTTAFVSATKLTAAILAADIAAASTYTVRVATASGVNTSTLPFTVTPLVVGPAITSLSPSSSTAGAAAFALTVNGTGFATGAIVNWAGSPRTTAFVSATKVTAAITAADVATAGNFAVTVKVGANLSNSVNFSVTPKPTVTSISPNYAYHLAPSFTMTVNGTNFTTGSTVFWGSTQLSTTFVSATQLRAIVPAANLSTLGTFQITVGTSGVMSDAVPFTVAPNTHLPLAYGFFNKDGSSGATSPNLSCTWSSPEYLCTITGEDFYYSKYVVTVTPGDGMTPAVATVSSAGGKIIVKIFNLSGSAIQLPFYITVFKP